MTDCDDNFCSDDPWFCPAHFCVRCGVLSSGNGMTEIGNRSLPSYCMVNGEHSVRKPLSSCGICAMSICLDCERDVGARIPVVSLAESDTGDYLSFGGCRSTPIEISKIDDTYDPSCDVYKLFFDSGKDYMDEGVRDKVSCLIKRATLPSIICGNPQSMVEEKGIGIGGRSARRRDVINYSENVPKKVFITDICILKFELKFV